jgi:iron complex outermembrane receptor protein
LLWVSVSRAVRTPSRAENDIVLLPDKIIQPGVISALKGNRSFVSEELIAYELGYRFQPYHSIQVDLSLFYNIYDNLLSFTPAGLSFPPQTAPLAAFVLELDNKIKAEAYGLELAFDWQPVENLKLRASYTFLKLQQHHNESNSADQFLAETAEGQAPEHQINILSSYQLTADLTLTLRGEYIDKLVPSKADSHFDMDLGLRYQMTKNLNVAFFGKNLLHDNRFEYRQGTLAPEPTKIEREGYLVVELKF